LSLHLLVCPFDKVFFDCYADTLLHVLQDLPKAKVNYSMQTP
jgi:hypothetical protein